MNKSLKLAEGFLATQLNYVPALMLVFTIYAVVLQRSPNGWKYILLGVVPFGYYLVRKYVSDFWVYLLLHLVIGALPYFLSGNIPEKVIFVLISIVYFVVSLYFKVAKKVAEDIVLFPAMTFLLVMLCYFSVLSKEGEKQTVNIAVIVVVYVVYYMIYEFLKGYAAYIQNNEVSTKNIPKGRIFKNSFGTLCGFLVLFIGFALFLVKGNFLGDLIYKIGALIKRFLIWLLSKAPDAMEGMATGEDVTGNNQPSFGEGAIMEGLYEIPPEVARVIDAVVTIGAYLIAGTAVLLLAYGIFRAIFLAFKVRHTAGEKEAVLVRERVTRIDKKAKEKHPQKRPLGRVGKVRKLYEDTVTRDAVTGIVNKKDQLIRLRELTFKTPSEQCRYLAGKENIRGIYEKARYSSHEITKEDVKKMKEACKGV